MKVETIVVGEIKTNCYVVYDETEKNCVVIDPGAEEDKIIGFVRNNDLKCDCIFLTHGHGDHYGRAWKVSDAFEAPIYINEKDVISEGISKFGNFKPNERTLFYKGGDVIKAGNMEFSVIDTPGHTPGGVCLICGDMLFCGDTLFRKSCGVTKKQYGGNFRMELKSLKLLAELPGDFKVYPGHMAETTLEFERNFNMYMLEAIDTVF